MHVETSPTAPLLAADVATATASRTPASLTRRGADTAARTWTMVEQSGRQVLIRSHPLTLEGEEIGRFDLTLACGEAPGSLEVGYSERRMQAGGAPTPLRTVTLSLGARSEPLQVVSSEPVPRSLEWMSRARGSVPVAFMRLFAELSSRALVVSTGNGDNARTVIRVGNSGIAVSLTRLQESCASRPLHATNARTGQAVAP
jgi:hypothetical protein